MDELRYENDEIKVLLFRNTLVNFYDTSVSCGEPIPYDEIQKEEVDFADILETSKDTSYVVEVKGDSMIDAGIEAGDKVIIDCSKIANEGDIVLASIDNEFYLKYYFKDEEGRQWFVPANKNYEPKLVEDGMLVRVHGVYASIIKSKRKGNARLLGKLGRLCNEKLKKMNIEEDAPSRFVSLMPLHIDRREQLAKIHNVIDGKTGVSAYKVILACLRAEIISEMPTYGTIKEEFGEVLTSQAYYKFKKQEYFDYELEGFISQLK